MELRHLRYFVAVAEALNFRRAADLLKVAQPALSKQIRDLEEELGARLLDRNTAGVRLTDAGAILLNEARQILLASHQAAMAVRDAAEGRRGRIVIGNIGAMSAAILPSNLTAFRERYPDVDVTLREMRSAEQPAALASGHIQIGLMIGLTPPNSERFEAVRVIRSPMRVFLAKTHARAKQSTLNIDTLTGETFLASVPTRSAHEHINVIRNVFTTRQLAAPTIKPVDSLESLLALIAGGHGISFLPGTFSPQRGLGLISRPLAEQRDDLAFSLWAVWRRDESSESVRNFVRLLRVSADAKSRS